jgi:hypothetical protein
MWRAKSWVDDEDVVMDLGTCCDESSCLDLESGMGLETGLRYGTERNGIRHGFYTIMKCAYRLVVIGTVRMYLLSDVMYSRSFLQLRSARKHEYESCTTTPMQTPKNAPAYFQCKDRLHPSPFSSTIATTWTVMMIATPSPRFSPTSTCSPNPAVRLQWP